MIGTRPELIKLAPLAKALSGRGIGVSLILTGQHPDLDIEEHGLGTVPAERLGCAAAGDPHGHVRAVTTRLTPMLRTAQPSLLVVQGDTSSALGGALAAKLAGIALAHVEAGLRSHDRTRPWPEEDFRIAIDREADLLFAPTALSAANLRRERLNGAIECVGNTAIDAIAPYLGGGTRERRERPRLLVTCHRRESWGDGLDRVAKALRAIAIDDIADVDVVLHPNPAVAGQIVRLLGELRGVRLLAPCRHQEMLAAMLGCDLLLSDSGGMQEEAPALGVPLLVLRDRTERPEGIAAGNMVMVGTNPERIVATVRRLLGHPDALAAMSRPAFPYGPPGASEKIAAGIDRWLGDRSEKAEPVTEAA